MTKKINYLAIGIVIAFVILMIYNIRSCNIDDAEIARLEAIVESRDAQLEEKDKAYENAKVLHKEKISELDGAIDSANTVIAKIEREQIVKDERIAELMEEDKQLEDYKLKYENMTIQRDGWVAKFTLSENKSNAKDEIIASWKEKFLKERALRLDVEPLIEKYAESIAIRDNLISELKQKLRSKQRASTFERTIGIAVVAALAYSALSK